MLFPVPADANRGFGRMVERYRSRVKNGTNIMHFMPEMAFKLFAGAMPQSQNELQKLKLVIGENWGARLSRHDVCFRRALVSLNEVCTLQ